MASSGIKISVVELQQTVALLLGRVFTSGPVGTKEEAPQGLAAGGIAEWGQESFDLVEACGVHTGLLVRDSRARGGVPR